jgi:hypothetical protein
MGQSWSPVDVGKFEAGADGNSDMDLVVDAQGTLYLMAMRYTTLPEDEENFDWNTMKGEHIAMGVSKDNGASWTWQYLSKNDYDDRPWVSIASDGSAHAIWNDGKGVHYRVSTDQGSTWEKRPSISAKGGSSHLVSGPNGLLAVRVSPESASGMVYDEGVDHIYISKDFGKSWTAVAAPGTRNWIPTTQRQMGQMQYWVEPLAFDAQGQLYYLWSEGQTLKLGISNNLGQDWNIKDLYTSDMQSFFPYLQIQDGQLLCTWLSEKADMETMSYTLHHHVAYISLADNELNPKFLEPLNLEAENNTEWQGKYYAAYGGEYFPALLLEDGTIGVVTNMNDSKNDKRGFVFRRLEIGQ